MFELFRKLFAGKKMPPARRRRARLALEACESRTLLSTGPVLLKSAHELLITGTSGNDQAQVSTSGNHVVVNFDGKTTSYNSSSIKEIIFKGGAGNDSFVDDTAIPFYAQAGVGNDTLIGGTGNDTLIGGSGTDVLVGGAGKNKIVGAKTGTTQAVVDSTKNTLVGISSSDVLDGNQELIAALTGSTAGSFGFAVYSAGTTAGQNSFELLVAGLTASTTYTVEVGGTSIGTLTTDSLGTGSLTLSNLTTSITAGAALTIVDASSNTVLQGTFAAGDQHGGGSCQGGQDLTATLTGSTGATGSAEFKASSTAGQNSFTLTVTGLTASTTYTVDSGSTSIGTFTTDSSGAGSLTLSDLTATIAADSALTVLDPDNNTVLSGTFAASRQCQHGENLVASLIGSTGGTGTADFKAGATAGANSFTLTVSGLTASTSYTVDVGGSSIGTIMTDSTGAGSLTLSDLTTTIAAGSVLTVVDANNNTVLQGTFTVAAEGGGCGGGDHHGAAGLNASLTGSTGTSGSAQFTPGLASGQNAFTLLVNGLTASTTYTVDIGSTSIGTFTTDANGNGSLALTDLTTTITAGATITVVDASGNTVLSGTFMGGPGGPGGPGFGFGGFGGFGFGGRF